MRSRRSPHELGLPSNVEPGCTPTGRPSATGRATGSQSLQSRRLRTPVADRSGMTSGIEPALWSVDHTRAWTPQERMACTVFLVAFAAAAAVLAGTRATGHPQQISGGLPPQVNSTPSLASGPRTSTPSLRMAVWPRASSAAGVRRAVQPPGQRAAPRTIPAQLSGGGLLPQPFGGVCVCREAVHAA